MNKKLVAGLFSGLILLQIGIPLSMIAKREVVLKSGTQFRFKTAPIDPYDAFRGRYVSLRIEANKVMRPQGLNLKHGQKIYAHITVDENGFAKFSRITTQKPEGIPYLRTTISYISGNDVFLNSPISRYYMEEKAAPEAEKIYQQHSRGNKQDAYVAVRIKNGLSVIEGLYVGGQRIEDAVRQKMRD